jgi:ribonuclease P protein component
VLPPAARMRRRQEFELAVRQGKRARGRLLTAHLLAGDGGSARDNEVTLPRIGFVVTRAVGGAVVRNRLRRRLRDVARMRAGLLPAGSLLVIRANSRAADARQRDLAADLDLVLGRLLRRQVRA